MPRSPYSIVFKECKHCHVTYNPHDPAEDTKHRKHHLGLKEAYAPKALTNTPSISLMRVEPDSAPWRHRQLHYRARALANEMKRKDVPWNYGRDTEQKTNYKEENPLRHGFLITGDNDLIVGGLCFQFYYKSFSYSHQMPSSVNGYWNLEWVWIAPKFRKKGHLARHWWWLREQYGYFHIARPVTDSLREFLSKRGDESLLSM